MPKDERKPCPGYRCQAVAPKGARWCPACWRSVSELTKARMERCLAALDRDSRDAGARQCLRIAVHDAGREIAAARSAVDMSKGAR